MAKFLESRGSKKHISSPQCLTQVCGHVYKDRGKSREGGASLYSAQVLRAQVQYEIRVRGEGQTNTKIKVRNKDNV